MSNAVELKTKLPEAVFDDFIFLSRQLGFESRSECLRALIEKELYGLVRRNKSRPKAFARTGPIEG